MPKNAEPTIEDEMLQDWLDVLGELWKAFGKLPTPETMGIYQRQLGSIPLGLLERAVGRAIRDHKYNSVPIVHDVWVALRKELGNPADIDQAVQDWAYSGFLRCEYRFDTAAAPVAVAVETEMQS